MLEDEATRPVHAVVELRQMFTHFAGQDVAADEVSRCWHTDAYPTQKHECLGRGRGRDVTIGAGEPRF